MKVCTLEIMQTIYLDLGLWLDEFYVCKKPKMKAKPAPDHDKFRDLFNLIPYLSL